MTLEQYKAKLDEELKAMDWHERDIKNSRAYKVLSAAAAGSGKRTDGRMA